MIEPATTAPDHAAGQPPAAPPRRVGPLPIVFLLVVAVALGVMIYRGIDARVSAESALVKSTQSSVTLDVAVTHAKQVAGDQEVVLPGDVEAFTDAPIYAR